MVKCMVQVDHHQTLMDIMLVAQDILAIQVVVIILIIFKSTLTLQMVTQRMLEIYLAFLEHIRRGQKFNVTSN